MAGCWLRRVLTLSRSRAAPAGCGQTRPPRGDRRSGTAGTAGPRTAHQPPQAPGPRSPPHAGPALPPAGLQAARLPARRLAALAVPPAEQLLPDPPS